MSEILYSVGKTRLGDLIRASDAQKGECYTCPECDGDLLLKKGEIRRAHFAHRKLPDGSCSPESVLHYGFKNLLAEKIRRCIDLNIPISIKWKCSICAEYHEGNLLKKARSILVESTWGVFRPDLSLFDAGGNLCAVIEVVVSHYPSFEAIAAYKSASIPVLIFRLKDDDDLFILDKDALVLSEYTGFVRCRYPVCDLCKRTIKSKRMVRIVGRKCPICGQERHAVFAFQDKQWLPLTDADKAIAQREGVFFSNLGSEKSFPACRGCYSNGLVYDVMPFKFGRDKVVADILNAPDSNVMSFDLGYVCRWCLGVSSKAAMGDLASASAIQTPAGGADR